MFAFPRTVFAFFAAITILCSAVCQSARTDAILLVREHPLGPEMVQITMTKPDYPEELLKSQIATLGTLLQCDPRGVTLTHVLKTQTSPGFLRADFAVDNLITKSGIKINALLKALAGAPEPNQTSRLTIMLEGVQASQNLVQVYKKPGVIDAVGRATPAPKGIEYQIELLSQDPAIVDFPERYTPPAPSQKVEKGKEAPNGPSTPLIVGLFLAAGLGLGALVYLLLLRPGSRS